MICHMFESPTITSESEYSVAVLLEDKLIILGHWVEARHNVCYLLYLRGHNFFHYSKLEVWVQIVTFVSHFVLGKVFTINCPEYHYPVGLFKPFEKEAGWKSTIFRKEVAMNGLFSHLELIGMLIKLICGCSTCYYHIFSLELSSIFKSDCGVFMIYIYNICAKVKVSS